MLASRAIHGRHDPLGFLLFFFFFFLDDLKIGGCCFGPSVQSIFFPRIVYSHYNRIRSCHTAVHCFDNGHVRMQPRFGKNTS